jgi:5-methylthioadenosine/S-adenosylhomocysteine deaminase
LQLHSLRYHPLAPNKLADFVVINANVDPTKPKPLDPVVKATPADISLVVVGGQPLYGDPSLLAQLLPSGTELDQMIVCGAEKAIYLGESGAATRGQSFADIKKVLNSALAKGSSSLPDIECD